MLFGNLANSSSQAAQLYYCLSSEVQQLEDRHSEGVQQVLHTALHCTIYSALLFFTLFYSILFYSILFSTSRGHVSSF